MKSSIRSWVLTGMLAIASIAGIGGLGVLATAQLAKTNDALITAKSTSLTITEGSVKEIGKSPKGEVDGWVLENGQRIHFPPHMGKVLSETIQVGDSVRVLGFNQKMPDASPVIEAWTVESDGKAIAVTPAAGRAPKGSEVPMELQGTIVTFVTNRHGDVDGVTFDDGTLVKFPPHAGAVVQKSCNVGDSVLVVGHQHQTPEGDVHLHADKFVVRDETVVIPPPAPKKHDLHSPRKPQHSAQNSTEVNSEVLVELRAIREILDSRRQSPNE